MRHLKIGVVLVLVCCALVFSAISLADEEYIGFARVNKGETNLRKAPGGKLLYKLDKDEIVYVLDKVTDASGVVWYMATINHNRTNSCETLTGFIRGDLLELPSSLFTAVAKISASRNHLLCILKDGRILAVGGNQNQALEVSDWTGMVDVVAGILSSKGLQPDGTVVTLTQTRDWIDPQWRGVERLVKGSGAVGAIRPDGTALIHYDIDSLDHELERNQQWAEELGAVKDLALLPGAVIGIMPDGTLKPVGFVDDRFRETVSGWKNVTSLAAGSSHVAALRRDGTVVATLMPNGLDQGQCQVDSWTDIIAIDGAPGYTLGLKKDGTVVIAGSTIDVSNLAHIVSIQAADNFVAALTEDGHVVFRGNYHFWAVFGNKGQMVLSR